MNTNKLTWINFVLMALNITIMLIIINTSLDNKVDELLIGLQLIFCIGQLVIVILLMREVDKMFKDLKEKYKVV